MSNKRADDWDLSPQERYERWLRNIQPRFTPEMESWWDAFTAYKDGKPFDPRPNP